MKTTEELLYQIRGLARIVVAFSFFYQGLVPKWLTTDPTPHSFIAAHAVTASHISWVSHLAGILEIVLALWLIKAFTAKTPLWVAGAALLCLLLDTVLFAPALLGATFNVFIITLALLALLTVDLLILNFDPAEIKAHQVKQYIRFTRDRMLYEFVKRLEFKDLPHLMHTLTQQRLKRRSKNRLKQKNLLKSSDGTARDSDPTARTQDYRRRLRRRSDISPLPERSTRFGSDNPPDDPSA